jgi:Domain of unknown function (DUF4082)
MNTKNAKWLIIGSMFSVIILLNSCQKDLQLDEMNGSDAKSFRTTAAGTLDLLGRNTFNIFKDSIPNILNYNDGNGLTLGVKFKADKNGYIYGVRFLRGNATNTIYSVALWSESGQLLATGKLEGDSTLPKNAWIEVPFTKPDGTKAQVAITANTTYIASYYNKSSQYVGLNYGLDNNIEANYATGSGSVRLTALGGNANNGNGVYKYASAAQNPATLNEFPNQSFRNSNYYVDVMYSTEPLAVNILGNIVPPNIEANDFLPLTLGVKFQSSTDGYISGIRFYRGNASNRAYSVALWTESGELIGEGTVNQELASLPGNTWLEVPLLKNSARVRVPVKANTTYIASYYCVSGAYPYEHFGLDNDIIKNHELGGTLKALGGITYGGDGVYKYATPNTTSLFLNEFPSQAYRNSNYFVDVVFSPEI